MFNKLPYEIILSISDYFLQYDIQRIYSINNDYHEIIKNHKFCNVLVFNILHNICKKCTIGNICHLIVTRKKFRHCLHS